MGLMDVAKKGWKTAKKYKGEYDRFSEKSRRAKIKGLKKKEEVLREEVKVRKLQDRIGRLEAAKMKRQAKEHKKEPARLDFGWYDQPSGKKKKPDYGMFEKW